MAGDLIIVPSPDFARTAADYIARAISTAAEAGDSVSLALSGGRGPRPVYQELARTPGRQWERVNLYFADERAVAAGDPRSNYRLVSETLGDRFSGRPRAIHRMEAERPDLAQAAADYEALLPVQLDILVLGMGEDGHTASLFPHHPAASEERRRVLGVHGPAEPPWRMTITPPVIRAARATLMLVAGEAKAIAVARAVAGAYDPMACPAQWARDGCWILDQPAAARLGIRSS
jgi:6-phosphogluconolactonase